MKAGQPVQIRGTEKTGVYEGMAPSFPGRLDLYRIDVDGWGIGYYRQEEIREITQSQREYISRSAARV